MANPDGLRLLGPSLIAGLAAALVGAGVSLRHRAPRARQATARGRAFNLVYAIGFAALLSAVTAAMSYLTSHFGELAVPVTATLAGFFDVHAAATSVLSVAATAPLPPTEALTAVLLAFLANTTSKLVAALGAGGLNYGLRVAAGLLLVVLAMWAPALWRGLMALIRP